MVSHSVYMVTYVDNLTLPVLSIHWVCGEIPPDLLWATHSPSRTSSRLQQVQCEAPPSSVSKWGIWRVYQSAADSRESIHTQPFVGCGDNCFHHHYHHEANVWFVLDLPTNSTAILRAANYSEGDKSDTTKTAKEHLRIVQVERSFYKTTCDTCCDSVNTYFTKDGVLTLPPLSSNTPPNSRDIQVHYSFDYAQQVHFPSDPLQPGPIYFLLTPHKCSVFGVNCEALPRHVNFLTDEAGECGKGGMLSVTYISSLRPMV